MLISLPLVLLCAGVIAQELKPIPLPSPDTSGGIPLMQALKERQSTREYLTDSIPMPVLSNLLWAACGVNRAEEGKRTAPSARNWQEIEIYTVTAQGVSLYNPIGHTLTPTLTGDHRAATGMQEFVSVAPLNLLFVADYTKMGDSPDDQKSFYSAADAAFISQNIYLFCASEGLGTVVRGSVDREAISKLLKLRPEQHVVLAQTVGYPKK
jgi:SagB-type dehydrogenase family enzyme